MNFLFETGNSDIHCLEQKYCRRRMNAAYGAWYSRRLPLRRLYPVNTSTLICVVCFICHNSKGKAKYAIILMDSSDEEDEEGFVAILFLAHRRVTSITSDLVPAIGTSKTTPKPIWGALDTC
ncbi:hypothetical protein GA0061102_100475 [Rhizobium miluonense]|uniref:Uncharacterized protein n=1 Tax=Rhizobium miluonense TaxID=411945 RepID=A0A1C3UK04_9HYPH|nr:hypothetical protein GA0061102_100475 [Rhizobium miluonense]